jgi:glycosyltransferase involved in cell wall biosynthesis
VTSSARRAAPGAPTIVTLTPIAVTRDSRTFRQAASVARLGFRSVVIEGVPSGAAAAGAPFELAFGGDGDGARPAAHVAAAGPTSEPAPARPRSRFGAAGDAFWAAAAGVRRLPTAARAPLRPLYDWLVSAVSFATYLVRYVRAYVLGPLRVAPPASLYYLHAFYQFPAVYWLSRWHRVPFVYDAHDFYSRVHGLEENAHLWRRWSHRFEAWLEQLAVRRAAAVVTVSEGLADEMAAAFGRRPVVIRNAHDARLDRAPARTLRERLGLAPSDFLVVVIGQAKRGMALAQVREAVAGLGPDVHVVFLGAGYDALLGAADLASGGGRVHVLPPVAPTEIVPFVRSGDAAMLPYFALSVNYRHSLPNGLSSSLAAGLPVLYPELPEFVRLARRHELGLPIDPLDPASIREAIARLAGDEALRARLRTGVRAAARELSWDTEERALSALLAQILSPAPAPVVREVATPVA